MMLPRLKLLLAFSFFIKCWIHTHTLLVCVGFTHKVIEVSFISSMIYIIKLFFTCINTQPLHICDLFILQLICVVGLIFKLK
jgi:hypothetical protein